MRRLLVLLVVALAALAALDRVAVYAAERVVASRLQDSQHLDTRPDVSIGGFPFLTQALRGRYDDVDVTVHGVHAGGIAVSRVTAHLSGVEVALGDVISQDVQRIPVAHATADVVLGYDEINHYLAGQGVTLSAGAGSRVHVEAHPAGVAVSADLPVTVQQAGLEIALPGGVGVRIPLPGLPFGVRLDSVVAGEDGLVVTGSASGLVVRR